MVNYPNCIKGSRKVSFFPALTKSGIFLSLLNLYEWHTQLKLADWLSHHAVDLCASMTTQGIHDNLWDQEKGSKSWERFRCSFKSVTLHPSSSVSSVSRCLVTASQNLINRYCPSSLFYVNIHLSGAHVMPMCLVLLCSAVSQNLLTTPLRVFETYFWPCTLAAGPTEENVKEKLIRTYCCVSYYHIF